MAEGGEKYERVQSQVEISVRHDARRGILIPAQRLVDRVAMIRNLPAEVLIDVIREHYNLALSRRYCGWIGQLQRALKMWLPVCTIVDEFPNPSGNIQARRMTVEQTYDSQPCRDIRSLDKPPQLVNAAHGAEDQQLLETRSSPVVQEQIAPSSQTIIPALQAGYIKGFIVAAPKRVQPVAVPAPESFPTAQRGGDEEPDHHLRRSPTAQSGGDRASGYSRRSPTAQSGGDRASRYKRRSPTAQSRGDRTRQRDVTERQSRREDERGERSGGLRRERRRQRTESSSTSEPKRRRRESVCSKCHQSLERPEETRQRRDDEDPCGSRVFYRTGLSEAEKNWARGHRNQRDSPKHLEPIRHHESGPQVQSIRRHESVQQVPPLRRHEPRQSTSTKPMDLRVKVGDKGRTVCESLRPPLSPIRSNPSKCNQSKRGKSSKCPVDNCPAESRKIKMHVMRRHIPGIYRDHEPLSSLNNEAFHRRRVAGLQTLAQMLLGPNGDIAGLLKYVQADFRREEQYTIIAETREAMLRMSQTLGWNVPEHHLSLMDLDSPALLIHWRILAFLVSRVSEEDQRALQRDFDSFDAEASFPQTTPTATVPRPQTPITTPTISTASLGGEVMKATSMFIFPKDKSLALSLTPAVTATASPMEVESELDYDESVLLDLAEGPEVTISPATIPSSPAQPSSPLRVPDMEVGPDSPVSYASVVRRAALKSSPVATVSPRIVQSSSVKPTEMSERNIIPAFDTHFHLDRLASRLGSTTDNIQEIVGQHTEVAPQFPVTVMGAVMVFCDPATYDQVPATVDAKWRVAVGIHPKKVHQLTPEKEHQLLQLVERPSTVAFGEVGLDYSDAPRTWDLQARVLEQVLPFCKSNHVLVIHTRGSREDREGVKVTEDCIAILKKTVPPTQKVHIHCFRGGIQQMKLWQAAFPECYFGVTGIIKHLGHNQRQALQCIPMTKLLLETDAPYHTISPKSSVMTPAYIGDVGMLLAGVRQMPVGLVLEETMKNAQQLYGC